MSDGYATGAERKAKANVPGCDRQGRFRQDQTPATTRQIHSSPSVLPCCNNQTAIERSVYHECSLLQAKLAGRRENRRFWLRFAANADARPRKCTTSADRVRGLAA